MAAWVVQSGLESGECLVGPVQPWPDFPANSTTTSAPSLWVNVSYCSSSGSWSSGAVVYQCHGAAAGARRAELLASVSCSTTCAAHVRGNRASAESTTTYRTPSTRPSPSSGSNSRTGSSRSSAKTDGHRGGAPRPVERLRRRGSAAAGQGDEAPARRDRQPCRRRASSIRARARQRALTADDEGSRAAAGHARGAAAVRSTCQRAGERGVSSIARRGARPQHRRQGHRHPSRRRARTSPTAASLEAHHDGQPTCRLNAIGGETSH